VNRFEKPVVVTGGAGFIGSEVTRQLVESGNDVIVIDNLINGKKENLHGPGGQMARLEIADIRDSAAVNTLLKGTDVVFHLACLGVRHSLHSPIENHEVNATATLQLVNAAHASGVARFVHVSTSEVYGTAQWVPMGEGHPTRPTTVYGASKLAGESYVRAFHETHGLDITIVRPFNAFGPRSHHEGDSGEVIPKMMLRALCGRPLVVFGDGSQSRDFTYVSDTAKAIIAAGSHQGVSGETINIGAGKETSVADLAETIASVVGRNDLQIEYQNDRPGDVKRLCADATLARDRLEYVPEVGMREGLEKLREWYSTLDTPPEMMLKDEIERAWTKEG
jgi:UDP-glucose 4-epimerase